MTQTHRQGQSHLARQRLAEEQAARLEDLVDVPVDAVPKERKAKPPIAPSNSAYELDFYGQYNLVELIGAGSQGEVYRFSSKDAPSSDPDIAVKVISFAGAKDVKERIARFQQEISALQKIKSDRIPEFYFSGTTKNPFFNRMEYVIGMELVGDSSLQDFLNGGRLTGNKVEGVMDQMLEALAEAHATGVVHKDINPKNIRVDSDTLDTYLTDFGIAKDLKEGTRLTLIGAGTFDYMSPEQRRGESVDRATDLYSLGIVLKELLPEGDIDENIQSKIDAMLLEDPKARKAAWRLDNTSETPKYIFTGKQSTSKPSGVSNSLTGKKITYLKNDKPSVGYSDEPQLNFHNYIIDSLTESERNLYLDRSSYASRLVGAMKWDLKEKGYKISFGEDFNTRGVYDLMRQTIESAIEPNESYVTDTRLFGSLSLSELASNLSDSAMYQLYRTHNVPVELWADFESDDYKNWMATGGTNITDSQSVSQLTFLESQMVGLTDSERNLVTDRSKFASRMVWEMERHNEKRSKEIGFGSDFNTGEVYNLVSQIIERGIIIEQGIGQTNPLDELLGSLDPSELVLNLSDFAMDELYQTYDVPVECRMSSGYDAYQNWMTENSPPEARVEEPRPKERPFSSVSPLKKMNEYQLYFAAEEKHENQTKLVAGVVLGLASAVFVGDLILSYLL